MAVDKRNVKNIYPLSPMQEGMLFHALMDRDRASSAYFEQWSLRLSGQVDAGAFEAAWNELFRRHDILRTVFAYKNTDRPLQVVLRERPIDFAFEDLRGMPAPDRQERIDALLRDDRERGFDLSRDGLMRVYLLQTGDASYHVIWSHHHIIMDGWSLGLIQRELLDIYRSIREGRHPSLAPVPPYGSYIKWLERRDREASLRYWREYLDGYENVATLPGGDGRDKGRGSGAAERDRGRNSKTAETTDIERWLFELDETDTRAVGELCRARGVTLNSVVQAAWGILLGRYNNVSDVVFGSVVSGRPPDIEGIESMVGLFINTVPVRVRIGGDGGEGFMALAREIHEASARSEPHHYCPLALIQAETPLKQGLFDHVMAMENYPVDEQLLSPETYAGCGFSVDSVETYDRTHYDFDLVALPGDRLRFRATYDTGRYDRERMERMGGHLRQIFRAVLADPDVNVGDIDILTPAEREEFVVRFNDTDADYPRDKTIVDLFEEQAAKTPDAVAVVCEGRALRYGELNERAERLATFLREKHAVGRGSMAAILLERTERVVVAILGILKAGAAYVPLDLEYPPERIAFMLENAGCRVVVAEPRSAALAGGRDVVSPDVGFDFGAGGAGGGDTGSCAGPGSGPGPSGCGGPSSIPMQKPRPDDPAYVIYTSGSTGTPKGCVVTHRNVVRLMVNSRHDFRFGGEDVWIVAHSLAFDFSVWEIYGALLYGGRVVVPRREDVRDVGTFLDLLRRYRVTVLNQTPPAFYNLIREECAGNRHDLDGHLRYVVFGGDRLEPAYLRPWIEIYPPEKIALVNMYGITETTVHVTYCRLGREDIEAEEGRSPIGRPLPETRVYVCAAGAGGVYSTPALRLQPVGVPGEMYVGGSGVAAGYLNLPDLTGARFLASPFREGERLYRSGDLGRRRSDGTLEYLGRNDHQVKIRGHRIELGEIEHRLLACPGVKEAAVLARDAGGKGFGRGIGKDAAADGGRAANTHAGEDEAKELVAYVVGSEDLNTSDLRRRLGEVLPQYMTPARFVRMDFLPLTANGKLDRKALPDPSAGRMLDLGSTFEAPRTDVEKLLAESWEKILGRSPIGIHDNYFSLGGDSIKAIRVLSRLHGQGVKVDLRDLFQFPTIAELAPLVSSPDHGRGDGDADAGAGAGEGEGEGAGGDAGTGGAPVTGRVPLLPIQARFFREHGVDPHHFNHSVLIRSRRRLNEEALRAALRKIREHHDALRMVYRVSESVREAGKSEGAEGVNGAEGAAAEATAVVQENVGPDHPPSFEVKDLRRVQPREGTGRDGGPEVAPVVPGVSEGSEIPGGPADNPEAVLAAVTHEVQGSFKLDRGPLMKTVLFRLPDDDRLLIVIHHLVVDGVSWRILLEDLASAYDQYVESGKIVLPPKTHSFKRWAEAVHGFARKGGASDELDFWRKVEAFGSSNRAGALRLPRDFDSEENTYGHQAVETVRMSGEDTEALLTEVNHAYNTNTGDILLTALARAIRSWCGRSRMLVTLESHGREPLFEDIDVSRTVGWFTSVFPFLLELPEDVGSVRHEMECDSESSRDIGSNIGCERDVGREIKAVKESLRRVPRNGIGYGILKYLTPGCLAPGGDEEAGSNGPDACMDTAVGGPQACRPPIVFNYLGSFDEGVSSGPFEPAPEEPGGDVSPLAPRPCELEVSGIITGGRLRLGIGYSRKQYRPETVGRLLDLLRSELKVVMDHCRSRNAAELTPSDLTYKDLSLDELDDLFDAD